MYMYDIYSMAMRLLYINVSQQNGWLTVSLLSLPKEDIGPDLVT